MKLATELPPSAGQFGSALRRVLRDTVRVSAEAGKKKRGREGAGDMVRSLSLVLVAVAVVWFFAQPPSSDEQVLRTVDPAGDIAAFSADVPAAPVPGALPAGWRPTSSTRSADPLQLRVGYVTPTEQYAEYAASSEPAAVEDLTGQGERLEPVDVDGVPWEQYRDADGSRSLARAYGPVTVVVGTTRGTASLEELRVLVRSLTVG